MYDGIYATHTHTHPFNGPLSRNTRVSRYQKGKPIWILLKQETVSGSGIIRAVCKSAPRSRQITTPAPHHSVFYRPDALPATQPTASKYWRHLYHTWLYFYITVKLVTCPLGLLHTQYDCTKKLNLDMVAERVLLVFITKTRIRQ